MSTRIKPSKKPTIANTKSAASVQSRSRSTLVDINHEVIERRVRKAGMDVIRRDRLSDETGIQYTLLGGGCINVYFTGTSVFGGKLSPGQERRLKRAFRTR